MKKIKILLENTQMRNLIYLFTGLIIIIILILIYNPNLEYRTFNEIVKEPNKNEYNQILKNFRTLETYTFKINYKDKIINGYSIAGTIYSNNLPKEIENKIKPENIYNLIKNENYIIINNEYIYENIKIITEKNKIKTIIYDEIIIEYGG